MTTSKFFKTNQQFSKAVEPRKTPLDDPSPCLELRIPALHFNFFSSLPNARDISPINTLIERGLSCIPFISTQMLSPTNFCCWTFYHNVVKCIRQQLHVVLLCSAHDERQRDATTVDEDASLAAIFFPDQLDCDRHFQVRAGLCSSHRRYFAIAKQCLPSHRIRQAPLSTISRRTQPFAIQENSDVLHLDCQIASLESLSIEFPSEEHKLSRPKQDEVIWVSVHLLIHERTSDGDHVSFVVLTVQLSPRTRPTSPMNRACVFLVLPWK